MSNDTLKFKEIFDEFPNAIFLLNSNCENIYTNQLADHLLSQFDNILDVFEKKDLDKLFSKKKSELDLLSLNGERTYHVVSKKINDLFLLELKDITLVSKMEKSVESQRALQNRLMISSERLKIISGVAHEINNPLMILNGNIDIMRNILKTGFDSEKADNLLVSSKKSINRIFQVLREKSSLNKLESFDDVSKINVYQFCQELLEFFSDQIRIDTIDVKLDMSLNKDVVVRNSLLKFVLVELIDNAFFFMQEDDEGKKYIHLSLERSGNYVNLQIHNSGRDIVIDNYNQMFEPFFTSKKSSDGTGVGLYHARQALLKYGSDLYYDDQHGDVCFVIQLKVEE